MKLRRTEERIIFVLRSLFLAVSTFVVYLLPRSCSTFAFSALFRDSGVWHWRVYTIDPSFVSFDVGKFSIVGDAVFWAVS